MKWRARLFSAPVLSAVLALCLYAVSLGGKYVFDDVAILQMDDRLTNPHEWARYWTESYNGGVDNLYRPLVSMTYAAQWWLHGDKPWAFHLVNILLHAAVCACLAEFVRRLAGSGAAYCAGLLFAAHPIHVEVVANVVGRAEMMCALGTIGALLLITRPLTQPRALALTACYVLALLSKEQGMLLPFLLLLLVLLRRRFDGLKDIGSRDSIMLAVLLLSWSLAGYIVWREHILKFWWDRVFLDWTINPMVAAKHNPHPGSVGLDRLLMPLVLLGHYAALLIAPVKLSIDYGAGVIGWHVQPGDPFLYLGVAAVSAWCAALAISFAKRSSLAIFACLALAGTYGVIGNIVTLIGTNFGERLMYLPSMFFLILIAVAAAQALSKKWLVAFCTVAVLFASVRATTYAARWNDKLSFYQTSLAEQPKSIRLFLLLSSEYAYRGNLAEAERVAQRGRDVLPEYQDIWIQCGSMAMKQGHFNEARTAFNHAMQINPSPKVQGWLDELQKQEQAGPTTLQTTTDRQR